MEKIIANSDNYHWIEQLRKIDAILADKTLEINVYVGGSDRKFTIDGDEDEWPLLEKAFKRIKKRITGYCIDNLIK